MWRPSAFQGSGLRRLRYETDHPTGVSRDRGKRFSAAGGFKAFRTIAATGSVAAHRRIWPSVTQIIDGQIPVRERNVYCAEPSGARS